MGPRAVSGGAGRGPDAAVTRRSLFGRCCCCAVATGAETSGARPSGAGGLAGREPRFPRRAPLV